MGFDNDHLGTLMSFGALSTPSFETVTPSIAASEAHAQYDGHRGGRRTERAASTTSSDLVRLPSVRNWRRSLSTNLTRGLFDAQFDIELVSHADDSRHSYNSTPHAVPKANASGPV